MDPATNYRSQSGFEAAMRAYEEALSRWPVPAEQRFVPTSIGETFVLSWGDPGNSPLVLLHGSAANLSSWGGDAEPLAAAFRVHAIDLPGETGKSTPARPPYGGPAYVDWLSEVLDGLGVERASLAGLSLGGWAALRFAAARPERVDGLVLLAPGGLVPARKAFHARALLYGMLGRRGAARMTRLIFSPEAPPPGIEEGFGFMLQHYRPRRDNLPLISDDELARVAAPTLLLAGAKDALLDMPRTAARIKRQVPQAVVEIDPEGGHAVLGKGSRIVRFLTAAGAEQARTPTT